jgi:hypothetical protein
LGSKYNWFTWLHVGQGTATEATVRASAASDFPEHFTVTLTDW